MSVTSVLTGRPTPYSPVSGNNSQSAKFAVAPAKPSQQNPAIQADGSRVAAGTRANGATPNSASVPDRPGTAAAAGDADPADFRQFQGTFAQTRRADGATEPGSSETSEADSNQSSAGIALYRRVSQIGNSEPSASELLRSWNSIMQSGQDEGDAGAATLRALLQSGSPTLGSSILDVTA